MPRVTRPLTLRSMAMGIILAPVALLSFGAICVAALSLLVGPILALVFWVSGVPLSELIPDADTLREFALTLGIVVIVVAVAAIPLVIRDFYVSGGKETVWIADPECCEEARRLAEFLVQGKHEKFYQAFSKGLRRELSVAKLALYVADFHARVSPPMAVVEAEEMQCFALPDAETWESTGIHMEPDIDERWNAMVRAVIEHQDACHRSELWLCLDTESAYPIVGLRYDVAIDEEEHL